MNSRLLAIVLILFSGAAHCSDPTGLFVFVFGIPFVTVAVVLFVIASIWPKVGLGLLSLLFVVHIPVMAWAQDVGYMDSAGGWLVLSLLVTLAGLGYSANEINKSKNT